MIEDVLHKGFHYEISECWLSLVPPPPKITLLKANTPVYISISALDKMVQMILTKQQIWRAKEDVQQEPGGNFSNLVTDTSEKQSSVQSKDILPGAHDKWRNTS